VCILLQPQACFHPLKTPIPQKYILHKQDSHSRFEVLSVVAKTNAVFWDVILCIFLPWRWRQ